MASIIPTTRNALRLSAARAGVPALGATPRYYSSSMHDNDPQVLEMEKRRNLSKTQHKTSTPIPHAPGWNEPLASASEAAIKADQFNGSPKDMQSNTVKYLKERHHSADTAMFNEPPLSEPGVSTQHMRHGGTAVPEASYSKEEVGGPLKDAHGTVVEKEVHKEDVIVRKTVL